MVKVLDSVTKKMVQKGGLKKARHQTSTWDPGRKREEVGPMSLQLGGRKRRLSGPAILKAPERVNGATFNSLILTITMRETKTTTHRGGGGKMEKMGDVGVR